MPGTFTPTPDSELERLKLAQERSEYEAYLREAELQKAAQQRAILRVSQEFAACSGVSDGYVPKDGTVASWIDRYGLDETFQAIRLARPAFERGTISAETEYRCDGAIRYVSAIMRDRAKKEAFRPAPLSSESHVMIALVEEAFMCGQFAAPLALNDVILGEDALGSWAEEHGYAETEDACHE